MSQTGLRVSFLILKIGCDEIANVPRQPLSAQQHLHFLREEVQRLYPSVVTVQSSSAVRIGEDLYDFGTGRSLYVQAPVTPSGAPRRWGHVWRTCTRASAGWSCHRERRQVLDVICRLAIAAGHQPAQPAP